MIALGLPCVEQSRGGEECVENLHLLPGGWNQGVGNIEEDSPWQKETYLHSGRK